jgi:leucyl aminopeptidase
MKVSFASERPSGAYALALPVWSDDLLNDRLASLPEAARTLVARAAEAQRFERELGIVAETFVAEGDQARRILLVGLGAKKDEPQPWEKAAAP